MVAPPSPMCIPMVEHVNANMIHPRTAIGITVESSSAATTSSSSSSSSRNNKDNTRKRRILNLLQHIPTFTFRFLRLVTFVLCLLPAFITFAYHYIMCDRQVIYYGIDPNGQVTFRDIFSSTTIFSKRRYLDIYGSHMTTTMTSTSTKKKKPVVIFLTGGAWIIGYRMWGTLLARALVPFGILVVIPDYRNFPCVDIAGMVNDVDAAIQWVFDHVEEYGGDANNVILVGQSAGAHIGEVIVAKKVLDWVRTERKQHQQPPHEGVKNHSLSLEFMEMNQLKSTYSPQQIRGFISTSCPHNLVDMRRVFHKHGFNAHVQWSIFGGLGEGANVNINSDDGDGINDNVVPPITRRYSLGFLEGLAPGVFEQWSPYHLIMQCHTEYMSLPPRPSRRTTRTTLRRNNECRPALKDIFPKLCIIHGTADETVPVSEAIEFISLLNQLHIPTETRMYHGWSHTDPILEAPMCGDHSYHRDIFELVKLWTIDDNGDVYSVDSNSIEKETNGIHNSRRKQRGVDIATFDERHPLLRSICPTILVNIARYCNPF